MQSIDSLRELNAKFLAEIAELRKKNAKISELREKLLKFAEVEAENVKLRQIIEENAKRDAENAELKTEVARLRHDIEKMKQQTQVITEVQDACSIEDIPPWNVSEQKSLENILSWNRNKRERELNSRGIVPHEVLSGLFDKAIKSDQKQILCWFYYSLEFENKVRNLTADGKIKDKTVRSKIYKDMKPFLPNITDVNLHKKTEKAQNLSSLHFKKIRKIGKTINGNQTNAFIPLKAKISILLYIENLVVKILIIMAILIRHYVHYAS
ncbi:hypothetical protein GLOIN_2v1610121 [Rhizophagus clarus]|uniref:Uncharacterized protein n=1 Tax=Rhizophagus clarus TaxID=94130 RepID=A0A8H3LTG9_9GLOM|nr:hypothetical protein GLOIN_2v1610121 [Rhizophagus clarus]